MTRGNRIHGNWPEIKRRVKRDRLAGLPPLVAELCRRFNAHPSMMLCIMIHGQLSIDGWVIRPRHAERWSPDQLRGRMAAIPGRMTRLEFSSKGRR